MEGEEEEDGKNIVESTRFLKDRIFGCREVVRNIFYSSVVFAGDDDDDDDDDNRMNCQY